MIYLRERERQTDRQTEREREREIKMIGRILFSVNGRNSPHSNMMFRVQFFLVMFVEARAKRRALDATSGVALQKRYAKIRRS